MAHSQLIAVLAMSLILTANTYADINDGLISAWTFDGGKADDAFGNSHGIFQGGASNTDDGMNGKALDVDGADGWVEVPDSDAFDVMEEAYTISVWVNVRAGRDHSAIVWKGVKVGWGPNFTARVVTTSDTGLTWGACAAGVEGWFATDGALTAGEWVHLCMTADGATVTGYVDTEIPLSGQSNPKGVASPYLLFKDRPFEFGVGRAVGGNEGNDAYLDAMIDEIYLYDRALEEGEVFELADGTRPRAVDSALGVDAGGKMATAWGALKAHR